MDRSGAYIVRQAAKSIVAAGLARRALVQVSYAIGVPEPLSVFVDTYGTGTIPDSEILEKVKKTFDFRAGLIGKVRASGTELAPTWQSRCLPRSGRAQAAHSWSAAPC